MDIRTLVMLIYCLLNLNLQLTLIHLNLFGSVAKVLRSLLSSLLSSLVSSLVGRRGGNGLRRRKEDKILIGAWLNTSKDAVVSNEQKCGQFWKRIVAYYNASPHLVGTKPRELGQCKQRWARINEQVSKFVGCYDAALREQRSGQNDDDVMKAALDYFYNDHGYKFSLKHGWRELRHDQKWCLTYLSNHGGKEKRKQVLEVDTEDEVGEPEARPVGVKAAKAASKRKKSGKEEELSQIQAIMAVKEKLSKQKLLERLLGKKEPLTEMETSLKLKLMSEMLG
ncbi:glutathione S-transferase T3-like [Brassica napus]|uniref:glutathione S-transferase T3-like n=1 Tax=Brassica napus TaxID=3708 RepID=UPI002079A5F6|nr:glutathione S-transferase T3-like [Brassica napus]